ncbi:MAG: hypothetical protein LBD74_00855 [Spirochaetaceae bacterium]|nr:hypothetical protein [Spirochaetaceae bacterium]
MDKFFDAGHIVSNGPILQFPDISLGELPEEAQKDFQGALTGGADFFILALLAYPAIAPGDSQRPESIVLKVYSTKPYSLVAEQAYPKIANRSPAAELKEIQQAAQSLLAHLGR